MEREQREGIEEETAEGAEEVEESAWKFRGREEGPADEDPADEPQPQESDDDSEVEEMKRVSDATLKRAIAPIADPLQRIG